MNIPAAPFDELNLKIPSKKDNIDWTLWENKYSRTLDEAERFEIKYNLLGLIKLLAEVQEENPEFTEQLRQKNKPNPKNKFIEFERRLKKSLE